MTVFSIPSPLGTIFVREEGDAVTGLWFEGQRYFPASLPPESPVESPLQKAVCRWLDRYFAGEDPGPAPKVAPKGTPFQEAVWSLLSAIPYGVTVRYGELAERLSRQTGRRASARAVGGAVGRNPISLLIPCHRVIGAKGALVGYGGGLDRKAFLLALERKDPPRN